jgi:hypothetical protein
LAGRREAHAGARVFGHQGLHLEEALAERLRAYTGLEHDA